MIKSKILSIAHSVPERVATNKELAEALEEMPERIFASTGVKERRYIAEGEGNVTLAAEATKRALDDASVDLQDIEMIVCATCYPDHQFPGTSAFLQAELGLAGCAILDVRSQGTGFLTALLVADQFIGSGMYSKILVVGSDIFSTTQDFSPRAKTVTPHFGDGAGVAVLGPSEDDAGVLAVKVETDARFAFDWYVPFGSIQHPRMTPENLERGDQYPVIHWDVINREAVRRIPEVLADACRTLEITPADLEIIVAPNCSSVMIRRLYKASGLPAEKFFSIKERFGDTGAAAIPMALSIAAAKKRIKPGTLLGVVGYGSGFGYGAAVLRW